MDERIEHGDDTSAVGRSAFGRREMLQRTGFVVGAAALWATPVVQTIGMRPAAASLGQALCIDSDGNPTDGCADERRPKRVSFETVGWNSDVDPVWRPFGGVASIPESCRQSFPEDSNRLRINSDKSLGDVTHYRTSKSQLNQLTGVEGAFHPISDLNSCKSFATDSAFFSFQFVQMSEIEDEDPVEVYAIAIHTSCSEYLTCGDKFASLRVCGGTDANNQPVTC